MNKKTILAFVAVAVLCAGGAGAAAWYFAAPPATAAEAKHAEKKKEDAKPVKYLMVDKVIVMMRRMPTDNVAHYMSADLVVVTPQDKEKEAKEQLPLLRSVAVRTLSALPMAKAQAMTIDQFAEELNKAFADAYEKEGRERPFNEVMIGKLILE